MQGQETRFLKSTSATPPAQGQETGFLALTSATPPAPP